jgi:chloramphenicol-sensitive protein RarD
MPNTTSDTETRAAFTAAVFCYVIWGFVPLAMQAMGHAGAGSWEILAHRIVWGSVTAGVLVLLAKQGRQVLTVMADPKTLGLLFLSAALIAINWVVFIYAVNNGKVMESALGYYINPLVNMAAGALIFREKLTKLAYVAIGLAAIGVAIQAAALGHFPLISLALAFSFGSYGIVRKRVKADAQAGLFVECLLLGAPCIVYILWLETHGGGAFLKNPVAFWWLIAAGPITATPLALFAWAARRMPLSAMGFLQFLAPTISFAIALHQGEAFTPLRAASFAFIWLGAVVFIISAVKSARQARLAAPPAAVEAA